jgi:hypothetical protein
LGVSVHEAGSEAFAGMTMEKHVMRGLDPRICRRREIAVSSTAMTALILNSLTPSRLLFNKYIK